MGGAMHRAQDAHMGAAAAQMRISSARISSLLA